MFKVIFLLCVSTFCVILQANSVATINCDDESSSIEEKLLQKLLCSDYDKTQRPVKNHQTAVNISMSIYMKEMYVRERGPSLILSVWMTLSWKDEFLTWNRADYGMEMVNIDSSEIWRPTIEAIGKYMKTKTLGGDAHFVFYYHSTISKKFGAVGKSCNDHKCELKHNGDVSCISPCTYEAQCISTKVDWPFDMLECTLHFSSWLEYTTQLNLTAESNVSTEYLKEDMSWKILSTKTVSRIDALNDSYPVIEFITTLERHMGVYAAILTPGFMVMAISLAVLWMDSSSSDRLHILLATCLGHYVYLEYIYSHMGYNNKDVPNILLFFRDSLLINVLMLIFTIILRHSAPRKNSSARLMDKLALRAASTSLGRMLLQADLIIDPKGSRSLEHNQTEQGNIRHVENGTNGDTVNLVVDGYDGNSAPIVVSTEQHRPDLGIIFMDRIALFCCMICYTFMLFKLIPKKML